MMSKLINKIKDFFKDEDYNIFRNVGDAIFGFIVLVIFPFGTLITVFLANKITWGSYLYPLITITVAGIYDSGGRFGKKGDKKNCKLWIRISEYVIAIILAFVLMYFAIEWLWVPPVILICDFVFIFVEMCVRINVRIKLISIDKEIKKEIKEAKKQIKQQEKLEKQQIRKEEKIKKQQEKNSKNKQ